LKGNERRIAQSGIFVLYHERIEGKAAIFTQGPCIFVHSDAIEALEQGDRSTLKMLQKEVKKKHPKQHIAWVGSREDNPLAGAVATRTEGGAAVTGGLMAAGAGIEIATQEVVAHVVRASVPSLAVYPTSSIVNSFLPYAAHAIQNEYAKLGLEVLAAGSSVAQTVGTGFSTSLLAATPVIYAGKAIVGREKRIASGNHLAETLAEHPDCVIEARGVQTIIDYLHQSSRKAGRFIDPEARAEKMLAQIGDTLLKAITGRERLQSEPSAAQQNARDTALSLCSKQHEECINTSEPTVR
jgi:hypothetical protein